jgi:purine-binding chemotaxis protein CheW
MTLPAIQHLLTCMCGPHVVGFHLGVVQEILTERPITRVPRASTRVCGLLNLRGNVVPAISLHHTLGIPSPALDQAHHRHIILSLGNSVVSLVADDVGEVLELDPNNYFPDVAGLTSPLKELTLGIYTTAQAAILHMDAELCCRTHEENRL